MINVEAIVAIVGGIAFLVGLFGGGVTMKELSLPKLPMWSRILSCLAGLALIVAAVLLSRTPPPIPAPVNQTAYTPTPTVSQMTIVPSNTATVTPPPTSTPKIAIPTVQTPIIQPSATPSRRLMTEQTVKDYYSAINDRRYDVTWSMLSSHFKDTYNSPQKGGYDAYVQWWDSVSRVDASDVHYVKQTGDIVTIFVELSYVMRGGTSIQGKSPYIQLIFDPTVQGWLFFDMGPNP